MQPEHFRQKLGLGVRVCSSSFLGHGITDRVESGQQDVLIRCVMGVQCALLCLCLLSVMALALC